MTATVSDRKRPVDTNTDGTAEYYEPTILSATDYYPFGMEMPNRTFNAGDYRFGFNGKEKDQNQEWGDLTHYDYGFRIYNPGIGRFLSVDPLASEMPSWSGYSYTFNNPVLFIDPDGREPILPLVGTIQQAINFFRDNGLNTVGAIDNFYRNPVDPNGNALRNEGFVRYVYTENNGWVDLRHYVGTFIRGETAMDALEIAQCAGGLGSCYSYEDLPSNRMGGDAFNFIADADFSPLEDRDYVPRTGEELFNGILEQFEIEGATAPENAPNFSVLPVRERPKVPSVKGTERVVVGSGPNVIERTIYYSRQEQQELINTGRYVPQNRSETPYNLNNFPTPAEGFRQN